MMKLISWWLRRKDLRPDLLLFLFTTPLLSARVYAQTNNRKELFGLVFLKLCLSLFFLYAIILFTRNFLQPLNYFKVLLISPMIYLFTEVMGGLGQLLFAFSPVGIAPIHNHPLTSKSLGEFWGKRWNFWVRDWLRDISQASRKNLIKKLIITFLVSGFFHELLVNLPHFLYFGELFFGNMTLYFSIQALGLWIEKKWMSKSPSFLGRLYFWAVIILPAPIFINRPLLIFFGIIDGLIATGNAFPSIVMRMEQSLRESAGRNNITSVNRIKFGKQWTIWGLVADYDLITDVLPLIVFPHL